MTPHIAARLGYVALYAAVGASFPYLNVYYQERGLSLATIGALVALAAGAGLVAAPVWGALADRFAGSRIILVAASLLAAVGAVALTLARDPIPVAFAVGLMAFAFAGLGPTLDARALETVEADRDRWAHMRAWGSGSFIVSVAITGFLIERTGTATIFVIYVLALLAVAVVTVPLRGNTEGARLPRLSGIAAVLRHPPLVRFLVAALLVWSASMSINWYFSIHLLDLGASGELVGSAWAVGAVVEIPIMSAYPWLVARFGSERLIVAGAAAFALRAVLLLVVTDPVLAAGTMAIHGVGFALVLVGGVTYVARHAPPATAATAQGVLSAVVVSVALMIGPSVGSWVAGASGVQAMFAVALAASLLGVPAVWLATRVRTA